MTSSANADGPAPRSSDPPPPPSGRSPGSGGPPPPSKGPSPPSRRALVVAIAVVAAVTAVLIVLVALRIAERRGWTARSAPSAESRVDREPSTGGPYVCPMHPTVVKPTPGTCPICGMDLISTSPEPTSRGAGTRTTDPRERRVLFYRSATDPTKTSHTKDKDESGADYLPVFEDEVAPKRLDQSLMTVDIDPARQQLIGLTTDEVTYGPVGGAWTTVGRIAIDETRVRHINVKVSGFIERIFVDFIGKRVRRGDPLFSMYSPELLSAQEEYLLALRTRDALSRTRSISRTGPEAGVAEEGEMLVAAARRKLELWDVSATEIDRIASIGQPMKALTFFSPVSGVVTKKDVVEGMKLDAGAMPYEIVDLSSVWVLIDIYEADLRFVSEKMPATLRLNAFPDRVFRGTVTFIDPMLDPATRTVKARLSFPNSKGDLRPEMFGDVTLLRDMSNGLRIPVDAVIDSGKQKLVFVALGDGRFEPRKIEVGGSDGTHTEVHSGVARGERVVTRANFLVDSESRLRASLRAITSRTNPGPDQPAQREPTRNPPTDDHSAHDHSAHEPPSRGEPTKNPPTEGPSMHDHSAHGHGP